MSKSRASNVSLVIAVTSVVAFVGCSAPTSADPDEDTTSEELQVAAATARCEGATVSFTLRRTATDFSSLTRPVRYALSNIVIGGVATPGTFSEDKSPLGATFRAEWWNGLPLSGSRFVTESRMHAEKPRGPDNHGQGWGGAPLAFNERVRCVTDLGGAPSFVDRFRLAYEYQVTKVYPGHVDPQLRAIPLADPSTLPPNLAPLANVPGQLAVFEFEGKRIYTVTKAYTVFYDAAGAPFATGEWRAQPIPSATFLSPAEWNALPRTTWRWGLDN